MIAERKKYLALYLTISIVVFFLVATSVAEAASNFWDLKNIKVTLAPDSASGLAGSFYVTIRYSPAPSDITFAYKIEYYRVSDGALVDSYKRDITKRKGSYMSELQPSLGYPEDYEPGEYLLIIHIDRQELTRRTFDIEPTDDMEPGTGIPDGPEDPTPPVDSPIDDSEPGIIDTGDPDTPVGIWGGISKIPLPENAAQAVAGIVIPGLIAIGLGWLGRNGGAGGTGAAGVAERSAEMEKAQQLREEKERAKRKQEEHEKRREEHMQRLHEKHGTSTDEELKEKIREDADGAIKGRMARAVEVVGLSFVEFSKEVAEAARTTKDATSAAWEGTKQAASATVQTAKDIYNDPGILTETISQTASDIGGYVKDGAQATTDVAKDVWNDPSIITDKIKQLASDVGNAIYTTVTDPRKAWETVKEYTGVNDLLIHAVDPNKSLLERIGHVGMGTLRVGAAVLTVGKISAGAAKIGAAAKAKSAGALGGTTAAAKATTTAATKSTTAAAAKTKKAVVTAKSSAAKSSLASQKAAFEKAQQLGQRKADRFIDALKSKDPAKIKQAALQVQGDNQALTALNKKNNFVKNQFNRQMQQVYRETDRRVIEQIARESGVNPRDVKVVNATNQKKKTAEVVKAGYDRDITYRVTKRDARGRKITFDTDTTRTQEIYNQQFNKVSGGHSAARCEQTVVGRFDAEAYGHGPSDLTKAVSGKAHKVADSSTMGKTISHKPHEAFAKAEQASGAMRERHMFDGYRQASKQWNNQVKQAVSHYTDNPGSLGPPRIDSKLGKAMDIVNQINDGVSPADITRQLRDMGLAPGDVANQVGEQFDMIVRYGSR